MAKGRVTNEDLKSKRLGEERYNNNGELMKIVEYNKHTDIVVEFQDEYKYKIRTVYGNFKSGSIKNPFAKSVCGVGITGDKYPTRINGVKEKEYDTWVKMLRRCFENNNEKHPTYKDATCCEEWLYYPNFYEWLHSQENFDKWYNGCRWCIDKDIIKKGNKTYSPDTCCLVPSNVNVLFIKSNTLRGDLPIGVSVHPLHKDKYYVQLSVSKNGKRKNIFAGLHKDINEAFNAYKTEKEKYIKQVAENEYVKGNITKVCYDAMMTYQVEITD